MKRDILLLVYFFLFSFKLNAQTATDYYPLNVSNYWVYKTTSISAKAEDPEMVEILKTEIECIEEFKNRGMAYRFKTTVLSRGNNSFSPSYSWYQLDAGSIISIAIGGSPDMILIEWDPPPKWLSSHAGTVGAAWTNKMEFQHSEHPDSTIIQLGKNIVLSNSEMVQVPAGTFENCILVEYTIESENLPVTYRYYAPNIGEVLMINKSLEGKVSRRELIEYQVGLK